MVFKKAEKFGQLKGVTYKSKKEKKVQWGFVNHNNLATTLFWSVDSVLSRSLSRQPCALKHLA